MKPVVGPCCPRPKWRRSRARSPGMLRPLSLRVRPGGGCACGRGVVPERDAIPVSRGDVFALIAAGTRRKRAGALAAALMLQNGRLLYAAPAVLNSPESTREWATAATAENRPTAERM